LQRFLAFGIVAATPAFAGLGGSVVPSYPTPISVGRFEDRTTITLTNTTPPLSNAIETHAGASRIFFTPSVRGKTMVLRARSLDVGVFPYRNRAVGDPGYRAKTPCFTRPGQPDYWRVPVDSLANNRVLLESFEPVPAPLRGANA
jgi:hypothetical protein